MYNPQRFKSDNIADAFELMESNPFATLITVNEDQPFLSHLPVTPKLQGDKIEIIGHLARTNPHWKLFTRATTTMVFQGPHTYITPQWYTKNDVPTWNYSVVHVSGTMALIEDNEGLVNCLQELTGHVERYWPSGWEFFIPDDMQGEALTKSIVGFKMTVDQLNFKRKLSQNRTVEDRQGVLRGLEARADEASKRVLADMRKLYSKEGQLL